MRCQKCDKEKGEKYWDQETDEWLCRECFYTKDKIGEIDDRINRLQSKKKVL